MYIVVISDHKWSTTHKVFKSHRSKISIICAQVPKNRTSCAQVHKLPQSHCGWKPGGHIVFMITYICSLWHCFHDIYMYIYIYILYYTILYYTILYKVSICNPGIATCGSTLSFDRSLYAIFLWNLRIKTSLLLEFLSPWSFYLYFKLNNPLILYTIFLYLNSLLATNLQWESLQHSPVPPSCWNTH